MVRWITGIASLLGLLALVSLAAPTVAHAQGAQHKETDLAFIRRMSSRLQSVERQAEGLEKTIQNVARQASQNEFMGRDQYGRENRTSNQDTQSDYRSAERQMRSARKRAVKEREKLVELHRAGSTVSEKDRERIERAVSGLERKIANMERDIRQRRL
jgi:predicted transcriptional regulator